MNIKANLRFVKESKELIEGIERLVRLVEFDVRNIELYQDEYENTYVKLIYKSQKLEDEYLMNYCICSIHQGTLGHFFEVKFNDKSIYELKGDFGFTDDQLLYLKYGNQNLYITEKEGMFDEIGVIFSEQELREWFNEYWEQTYAWEEDDFQGWLKVTVQNGYLKMYILFE